MPGWPEVGSWGPTDSSPAEPNPGPISTVGAAASPPAGNQWARMVVPSKEVTSRSVHDSPTIVLSTSAWVAPCVQAGAGSAATVVGPGSAVGAGAVLGATVVAGSVGAG